jgi:hypothetical protein
MNIDELSERLMSEPLLTVEEVGRILRVDRATAAKMIGHGLEGINVGRGTKNSYWRITSRSVRRLLGLEDNTERVPA